MSSFKYPLTRYEYAFFVFQLFIIALFVIKTLNGGILYWDDGFYPFNPHLTLIRELSAWNSFYFPGDAFDGSLLYLPFITLANFLTFLQFNFNEIESIYLITFLFIGGIGTYLLSRFITTNYLPKDRWPNYKIFIGSAVASFYFVFNYEQMAYYGGEFYQGFTLVNLTPLLLYFLLQYLENKTIFKFWNKYLGLISITSVIAASGINIGGSMGAGIQWLGIMVLITIISPHILNHKKLWKIDFLKKFLISIAVIILSMAWVFPFIYFNIFQVQQYAESTFYNGHSIIIAGGYNTILSNAYSFLTSGFGDYPSSFVLSRPYNLWYAPLNLINHDSFLAPFVYAPFILSIFYIAYLNKKWVNRSFITLTIIYQALLISFLFQFINTRSLSYSASPLLSGFNFFLQPYWSIYAFISFVSISLAISLNLIQRSLNDVREKDTQSHLNQGEYEFLRKFKIEILNIVNKILIVPKDAKQKSRHNIDKLKPLRYQYRGRLTYYSSILIIIILISLYIFPIYSNPLEYYEYDHYKPVGGVFKVNNAFNEVGMFLSQNSPYYNVLYLPVTISPSAGMDGHSMFMIVMPPFGTYTDGQMISQDPGPINDSYAYPILSNFPNVSTRYFYNFLKLLSIRYIVVNTGEYPTWVNQTSFEEKGPPWDFKAMLKVLNNSNNITFVVKIGPYYIYEVDDTLPLVYPSYMVPQNRYNPISPDRIYDLYGNGNLTAGRFSIVNSSQTFSGLMGINSTLFAYSSYDNFLIKKYSINVEKNANNTNISIFEGYYNQLDIIKNYSKFGINSNMSNVFFQLMNGSSINAWIEYHNLSVAIIWLKIPYNVSKLYMCVLPENVNILSRNGFVGEASSTYDNIANVFPEWKTNYHFESPFNSPNSMQILFYNQTSFWNDTNNGFGFMINTFGNMNFTDWPFLQMNSPNNWNPAFQFFSKSNQTGYLWDINGNTSIPFYKLKFGYEYVYNTGNETQNTYQDINGAINIKFNGDDGLYSQDFVVDGARTINITFSDVFQFIVPNGGMPNITINSTPILSYPFTAAISGENKIELNKQASFGMEILIDNKTPDSNLLLNLIRNSTIEIVNDSSGSSFFIPGNLINQSIEFEAKFNELGYYTILFSSRLNDSHIYAIKNIFVYDKNTTVNKIFMGTSGPSSILPGKSYIYNISLIYANGTFINKYLMFKIIRNLTLESNNTLGFNFKFSYSNGQAFIDIESHYFGLIGLHLSSIFSNLQLPHLSFKFYPNSEFSIKVESKTAFYLILNYAFNSGWKLSLNGRIISEHYVANGFANAWYLPSGNYSVSIYFEPQKYQDIAFIISGVTVISFITILTEEAIMLWIRKIKI
ncbi:MAG: hypothetical protein ACP5U0_08210 [Caldisphaera sp.]